MPVSSAQLFMASQEHHVKPHETVHVLIGGLIAWSCSGGVAVDERFLRGRETTATRNIGEEQKDPKWRPDELHAEVEFAQMSN